MINKVTLAPLVALAFAVIAYFGVGLPATVTQENVIAAVMAFMSVYVTGMRLLHGDYANGIKAWYTSKVLWVQLGTAISAIGMLFGKQYISNPTQFAEGALMLVSVLTVIFGSGQRKVLS